MADDPFSRLPALGRVVALARSLGMKAEPYYVARKPGEHKYPYPQKKKLLVDGVLCAVSTQAACWVARADKPESLNMTQVHAEQDKPGKLMPKVLIFDLRLSDKKNAGIWSVTRKKFFDHYPSGHANIPTGSRVLSTRSSLDWDLCEGADAFKECIAEARKGRELETA